MTSIALHPAVRQTKCNDEPWKSILFNAPSLSGYLRHTLKFLPSTRKRSQNEYGLVLADIFPILFFLLFYVGESMNLQAGDVFVGSIVLFVLWSIFLDPSCGLFWSRSQIVAYQRKKRHARGITMTKNFLYRDPDGSTHVSRTGRARDCRCGGKHISHQHDHNGKSLASSSEEPE